MKIAIVGSMNFAKDFLEIKAKLEKNKHVVILPENSDKYATGVIKIENKMEKIEKDVFKTYFEEIKKSEAILVINKEKNEIKGYIGGNSLIEMAFAYILNKKVFLWNEIPKMIYTDEIEALNPIVIKENLNLIK